MHNTEVVEDFLGAGLDTFGSGSGEAVRRLVDQSYA
jgi:hypothetical protein